MSVLLIEIHNLSRREESKMELTHTLLVGVQETKATPTAQEMQLCFRIAVLPKWWQKLERLIMQSCETWTTLGQ